MKSDTLTKIKALVAEGKVRISDHGYDELADDDILAIDVVWGRPNCDLGGGLPAVWGKGQVFLSFRRMPPADPYMSFGAFRKATQNGPWW